MIAATSATKGHEDVHRGFIPGLKPNPALEMNPILVGGWATPLKNISQLGWLFPIYGKIKNVPNHQPESNMKHPLNGPNGMWNFPTKNLPWFRWTGVFDIEGGMGWMKFSRLRWCFQVFPYDGIHHVQGQDQTDHFSDEQFLNSLNMGLKIR